MKPNVSLILSLLISSIYCQLSAKSAVYSFDSNTSITKSVIASTDDRNKIERMRWSNSSANHDGNNNSYKEGRYTPHTIKPTRVIGDLAKKIEGTYKGSGLIKFDQEEIENLSNISVKLKKIASNIVEVSVIEADGNDFFGNAMRYKVAKDNHSGSIVLKCESNKSMTIIIDDNGKMTYKNPAIEIDEVVYTLYITAKKQ